MAESVIELDGSLGEGGGQILRTSLTLSLLTGKAFRLRKIRAGRPKPGLHPQHLMSVRAAASIGQARVEGDRQGGQELLFEPGAVTAGEYHFSIGTAGATGLVLQTIYLPLALNLSPGPSPHRGGERSSRGPSPHRGGERGGVQSHVTITGGTHVKASPCFQFLDLTWRSYLQKMGMSLQLKIHRPGFYPRGGGVIEATIEPAKTVLPLRITSEEAFGPPQVTGFSAVAGLPVAIAERQARQAISRLHQARVAAEIPIEVWPGGPGTVLGLLLNTAPAPSLFFGLGERGKPAERVADEAVDALLAHVAADASAVDSHSADQLVLPLAMAEGPSEYPVSCVTQHLLTNIEVVRRFVSREIVCEGAEGEPGRVSFR